jgi:hypothetical protein
MRQRIKFSGFTLTFNSSPTRGEENGREDSSPIKGEANSGSCSGGKNYFFSNLFLGLFRPGNPPNIHKGLWERLVLNKYLTEYNVGILAY